MIDISSTGSGKIQEAANSPASLFAAAVSYAPRLMHENMVTKELFRPLSADENLRLTTLMARGKSILERFTKHIELTKADDGTFERSAKDNIIVNPNSGGTGHEITILAVLRAACGDLRLNDEAYNLFKILYAKYVEERDKSYGELADKEETGRRHGRKVLNVNSFLLPTVNREGVGHALRWFAGPKSRQDKTNLVDHDVISFGVNVENWHWISFEWWEPSRPPANCPEQLVQSMLNKPRRIVYKCSLGYDVSSFETQKVHFENFISAYVRGNLQSMTPEGGSGHKDDFEWEKGSVPRQHNGVNMHLQYYCSHSVSALY